MTGRFTRIRPPLLLLAGLSFCGMAAAQTGERTPFYRRFWLGVRLGGVPTDGMTTTEFRVNTTATSPPETINNNAKSAAKRFTVGPSVHYSVSGRLGLNADFLYKRSGYDSRITRNVQREDGTAGDFLGETFERTRADFWDIPILLRLYNVDASEESRRFFVAVGPSIRAVTGIKTYSERINQRRLRDTASIPIKPAHSPALGAVFAAGLQLRDEIGIKFELEGRYTRWFQRVFDANLGRMNIQQAEVLVSLTF